MDDNSAAPLPGTLRFPRTGSITAHFSSGFFAHAAIQPFVKVKSAALSEPRALDAAIRTAHHTGIAENRDGGKQRRASGTSRYRRVWRIAALPIRQPRVRPCPTPSCLDRPGMVPWFRQWTVSVRLEFTDA